MDPMTHFYVRGAIAMGFLVIAGFFFRFWRETHDRLFAFFAAAFFLLAINGPLVQLASDNPDSIALYVTRLLAYAIILIAIVDKNLRRT